MLKWLVQRFHRYNEAKEIVHIMQIPTQGQARMDLIYIFYLGD